MPKSVSLIVGNGELPIKVIKNLNKRGMDVDVIGIEGEYDSRIKRLARRFQKIYFYQIEKGINILKEYGNRDVIFAGGIDKSQVLNMFRPEAIKTILRLKSISDEHLFTGIIQLINKEGFNVVGFTHFYEEGLVKDGIICGDIADSRKLNDALYGMNFIKHNSDYSIGQSVIIKNENVLAVETIFGTDFMLKNYSRRFIDDAVFVKCSKKTQDLRIDLPSIGERTIDLLIDAKIRWVFLESSRAVIIGDRDTVNYAFRKGINICGIKLE